MTAPLAILRPHAPMPLPAGLSGEPCGAFLLVHGVDLPVGRVTFGKTRSAVLQHAGHRQAQLESLLPLGPVLALQPGARLTPADLAPAHAELAEWCDRLEGRVQFQLTVCWDMAAPRRCPTRLPLPPDKAAIRIQLEARLSQLVQDSIELPLGSDDMLMNRVLLLDITDEGRLDALLARIDALCPERLRLRLVGPSPAVSFALAALRRISGADVGSAAAALGLGLPSPPTGAALAALGPLVPERRRRALRQGCDPDHARLLSRVCALSLPPGPLEEVPILSVRREGCADPVGPRSLPAPGAAPRQSGTDG
ncbi:GvpL/GvpF family gas vesicle protein [Salipiger pacificus]|nr:GvpL/GvpF family gas vesicle protein [Alloyangia pacifica]MCA0944195.1 GvpL/GvpF family gas vesicle protein [Alloyangia pacifica]